MVDNVKRERSCFRFEHDDLILINKKLLAPLKQAVDASDLLRFRYCLHKDDNSSIHEMLIGFKRGSNVPIHRHISKSESFHVIQGVLDVVFYDDNRIEKNRITLGDIESGLPFMYRLAIGLWHTVEIKSDYVFLHEITEGPFKKEKTEVM